MRLTTADETLPLPAVQGMAYGSGRQSRTLDPSILTDHDAVGIGLDFDRASDGAGCDRVPVVVEAHQTGLGD